jgi:hypothetical protein
MLDFEISFAANSRIFLVPEVVQAMKSGKSREAKRYSCEGNNKARTTRWWVRLLAV